MPRQNKYSKGVRIETLEEFQKEIDADQYIYMNNTAKHPAFIQSMPYRVVMNFLKERGREDVGFFYAIDNTKYSCLIRFARALSKVASLKSFKIF